MQERAGMSAVVGEAVRQAKCEVNQDSRPEQGAGEADQLRTFDVFSEPAAANMGKDVHGVDASRAQCGHACVVVQRCVDAVDTNGVDAKLFHVRDVSGAAIRVGEWVHEVAGLGEGRSVQKECRGSNTTVARQSGQSRIEFIASAGKSYGSELVMSPCSWYARP